MDAEDRKLFEAGLRQTMQSLAGAELDAALDDLGWRDALADDPATATATLFGVQGATNAMTSALDDVVLAALGVATAGDVAVVLPAVGGHQPPARLDGDRLLVEGLGTRRLTSAEYAVVVASAGADTVAYRVPTDSLQTRVVEGIDPAGQWVVVNAAVDVDLATASHPPPWPGAVAAGQLAVACELTAAARVMLGLARDHAMERIQFGRPVGSFQAVRHRLADSLLAVESADAAVSAAWDDTGPFAAAMAKAIAGRAARTVARHAQQVLAGIGFTTEHRFQLYLRRVLVLDRVLGTGADLSAEIGAAVVRTGRVPAMLPL